ncbi:MAG: putative sulfate exporter family transporter [Acidobacteriota bacterium]|nr:putative sulfate exporter family transporter [Acidobacteriota bacterium]
MPAWLPSRREVRGVALAVGLALVALVLTPVAFSGSPWVSPIVVAIGLGVLVLNSPVAGWVGLKVDSGREGDAYERGLRYTGKWVLRLAIVLMGLKARTDLIEPQLLARVLLVLVVTLPTTFFVAHATAGVLKLRREMADLVAIGTMICGASAINALAPTVFARRRDQGLAVTTIFLFSVVALMLLLPVGTALGLDTESAGLWAGLAVNDLSSSVAVGGQFGEDESVMAAMAKTIRIVLLGPLLLVFSQLRRRAPAEDSVRLRLTAHFPLFVVGYLLLFGVRALGDRMFAATGPAGGVWAALLEVNDDVVSLAIAAVCASIGLQIHFRTLVDVGWRVAVTAGAAWVTIAGLSLGLLTAEAQGATVVSVTGGLVALGLGFVVFRRWGPTPVSLWARLEEGEPLTLRETVDLLALLDQDGPISAQVARRVLERVQPAIGELVSLRESPIQGGINYRRLTYWRSPEHGSSLVGILWTPGTTAHIHSHDYSALGRRIEGTVEVVEFARAAADRLRVISRTQLGASTLTEFTEGDTVHLVRNVGAHDAIDLHFCGPRGPHEASRYTPREADPTLAVGQEFAVDIVEDRLPVVMSVPGE